MPVVLLIIIVAFFLLFSSLRWRKTPEQRKAALKALSADVGGEVGDYADGGTLKFSLSDWPAELRVYALPKEPLGVSTEILVTVGPTLSTACEILGDRLMPAIRRAAGLQDREASFEELFRDKDHTEAFSDPEVRKSLLDLWALGPPKYTRLCCRDGVLMLSKDQDFCKQDQLQTFLRIARRLTKRLAAPQEGST